MLDLTGCVHSAGSSASIDANDKGGGHNLRPFSK